MANATSTINEAHVNQISLLVRAGLSPDEAARQLAQVIGDDATAVALAEFRKRTGRIRSLRDPGAIVDDALESWYIGPQDGHKFWPAYEKYLRGMGWDERMPGSIASLDQASTKVVSFLSPPGAGSIRTRGLVLGYVQSGKTANFTAVIAKAADAGYRFFLVLSGINNALRRQTQERLDREIIALNPEEWITITDSIHDFRATTNVNAFLGDRVAVKILGVVKKNKFRLTRLLNWLKSARSEVLRNCPVLIIDDEADQASPNSARDQEDRTAINKLLVEILGTLPKAAYVGYTATPFANLLIDPAPEEDLYPRDFIVDLPRPDDYFGPERIFGRDPLDWEEPDAASDGLDMIREVPEGEVPLLKPANAKAREGFKPVLTNSLRDAVRYFILAAATRRFRGQSDRHCSMLVHTSEYTSVHDGFKDPIENELKSLLEGYRKNDKTLLKTLREQWEQEQLKVPSALVGQTPTSFDQLLPFLEPALKATEVILEHSRSAYRLNYGQPGRLYIVVGGNVLSRGLTIEGLTVSFFIRSASAYDTLLQMGRWFGFRPGYEDLPRIWMTEELEEYFRHLAIVEREIRFDIDRYKNREITPLEFGVRIRTHPQLAVTSKLKMQHAVAAEMSFSGTAPQAIVFRHKDRDWLNENLAATRGLISAIRDRGISQELIDGRPHRIFREVPAEDILTFLTKYHIDASQVEMPSSLLQQYVRAQNAKGRLKKWDVAVIGRAKPKWGTIPLGPGYEVPLINRAKYDRRADGLADIKALMSALDPAVDMDISSEDLRKMSRPELIELRDQKLPDTALLLLYPINKDSRPTPGTRDEKRKPLEAVEHVIGLALAFPDSKDNTPQSYVTADLSQIPRDEVVEEEDTDE